MTGVTTAYGWMVDGTDALLAQVDRLDDAAFAGPSLLPGWSRSHLLAHVHFNAEALTRLAEWARTGIENPMYADAEQRAEEIAHGATLPPDRLRELVHASARRLRAGLDRLGPQQWRAEVRTARGRTVPATEIAWLRTREVWVHTVDLDVGFSFRDVPADVRARLAGEAATAYAGGEVGPQLVAWLTGRAETPPRLDAWL